MILDSVSLYNLGYTRNETCQLIKKNYLTLIEKHCPHYYFQSGSRSSKADATFELNEVTIKRK